jgi:hypothetical protein
MIELSAPKTYTELSPKEKKEICNGCGAKGGIPVPNTFYGLDISEACNIHDFRYYVGTTWDDKVFADMEFGKNLDAIIDEKTWFNWLKKLRKIRAREYVLVVKLWGDNAYRAGKGLAPRDFA